MNAPGADRGFLDSLDFKVDGNNIQWTLLQDTIDVCRLILTKPLLPGEKIIITTPFHLKIPSAMISRLGHTGQAYYITQWFPKPAVFDRNGWNYFPYLNQGEFYSEFGTYDVFITLPENYVVGATGDLVDGEKEIEWLNDKAKETRLITKFSYDMNFPPSSVTYKTLHYHEEKIHDFAWFADKRWHVLKEEIELPGSKKIVAAWLMFTNVEAEYWMKAMEYTKTSLQYFSTWIGEYPYKNFTAVDVNDAAGNGMEYPAMATIGNYGSPFELEVTMAHEIGHSWFFGILGNNERTHPWMDEGLTNFLETRYVYTRYSGDIEKQLEGFGKMGNISKRFGLDKLNHRKIQYVDYLFGARRNSDQPPETPAGLVAYSNYHGDVYYKTALSFDFLKSYLGDSAFDACLHSYFNGWKFKHPAPADLKNCFVATSGKNLDWLFDDLIKTTKKLDYKISGIKLSGDKKNYFLTIKNSGDIASPFSLSSLMNGDVEQTRWFDGFRKKQIIHVPCNGCDAFKIDAAEKMPELDQRNNTIRTDGWLKKTEPVRFQWLGSLEDPTKTQFFFSPVAGWNNYNKVMAGAAFYNIFIPEKRVEYVVMPMYAFGTADLTGGGNISYNFYPANAMVHQIQLRVGAQTYSYQHDDNPYEIPPPGFRNILKFSKIDSRISLFLLPKDKTEKVKYILALRNILIQKDIPFFYYGKSSSKQVSLYEFNIDKIRFNEINPSAVSLKAIGNNNLFLASIENKFTITYNDILKGFDVRLYAGNIFYRNTTLPGEDYRLRLSGYTGADDYLFDELFLGRTETTGMLAQQFVATEGSFVIPTYFYRLANKWLVALNLKTSLPGILPVKLFADIATFDHAGELTNGSSLSFEMGAELNVIKNIFTIYFPFAYSEDIQYIIDREKLNYGNLVRFELHLNKLNPVTLIKQIEF